MASRDFLGGFGRDGERQAPAGGAGAAGGESDEIELSLGLSLGGCFGDDPSKRLRLHRSSSIASICSLPAAATSCGVEAHDAAAGAAASATAPPPEPDQQLLRTSSLPAEYMEDRLRRRAMQSQRRLEAKRKRLERRNSMNSGRQAPAAAAAGGGGAAGRDEGLEHTVPTGFQLRRTVAALTTAGSPPSRPQQGLAERRAEASSPGAAPTSSDGASVGQQSSTTAGGSRPSSDGHEQQQQPPPAPAPPLRTLRSLTMRTASTGDLRNTMAEDMPMVSYKAAEGPSASGGGGRKIDGFLYKYRKGEEVRIVCVCHGSFFTPAEFVKHAGGGEVTNPLRHIVVNPQQSVFL